LYLTDGTPSHRPALQHAAQGRAALRQTGCRSIIFKQTNAALFLSPEEHGLRLDGVRPTLRRLDPSGRRTMTVRAILESKGYAVVTVEPDASVSAAAKLLSERRIGALLVMNANRIEGILSERDIVRVLGERGAAVLDEPVHAVMTRRVVTCGVAETVAALMEKMTEGKFRHLPVVEDNHLIGLISIGDVVKRRVMEYEQEQEAMRDYIKTA
jgi:CBS domain-containing protein